MFKIDNATAVASMPTPAAAGTPGYFSEGDPSTGTPATIVSGDFLNALMMELVNILVALGVTPSKTTFTQLRDCLPLISGNSVRFPSGLIVNWGNDAHSDNTGAKRVTFATPFVNAGPAVSVASNQAGGVPAAFHGTNAGDKTGMTVYSAGVNGSAAQAGTAFRWIALGF